VSSPAGAAAIGTTCAVILSLSFCHLLNDLMQSLVRALCPILKSSYGLSFSQVGLITLAFQFTASMLRPVVGLHHGAKAAERAGVETPAWAVLVPAIRRVRSPNRQDTVPARVRFEERAGARG
jgi:hypothetical protein